MSNAADYARRLVEGAASERSATIKLGPEGVAILEKLRRPTTTASGRPGRLQSYCEVAEDLLRIADEVIQQKAVREEKKLTTSSGAE